MNQLRFYRGEKCQLNENDNEQEDTEIEYHYQPLLQCGECLKSIQFLFIGQCQPLITKFSTKQKFYAFN